MEGMNNRMMSSGRTLDSDPTHRLPSRPKNPYEDRKYVEKATLGKNIRTQGSKTGNRSSSEAKATKFRPSEAPRSSNSDLLSRNHRRLLQTSTNEDDEESGDELDFLSGLSSNPGSEFDLPSSQHSVGASRRTQAFVKTIKHASTTQVKNIGKQEKQEEQGYTDKQGNFHPYDPKHPEKSLKNLHFKKNNKLEILNQNVVSASSTTSSTLAGFVSKENKLSGVGGTGSLRFPPEAILDLTLSSPVKVEDHSDARSTSPLSGKSANSNRPTTPLASGTPLPLPERKHYDTAATPRQGKANARVAIRPRPIPNARSTNDAANILGESIRKDIERRTSTAKAVNSKFGSKSGASLKPNGKGLATFPIRAEDILTGSKVASGSSARTRQPSPPHGSDAPRKGKSKQILSTTEDESDDEGVKEGRKKNLKYPPNKKITSSTSSGPDSRSHASTSKRSSEAGSSDERSFKKSRRSLDKSITPTKSRILSFVDEGDSLSFIVHVDPNTLCPFCDCPLPSQPTPLLTRLMETTKTKAMPDPRPTNTLGLRAPLMTYITVCQRHRFETKILPEAERKGWPKAIKWEKVSGRVMKMKDSLDALIEGLERHSISQSNSTEWEILATNNLGTSKNKSQTRSKATSIFWTEFLNEVKKKGLRAMSGFHGQFATFDKAQPGYYGEMGSVIIHQTLYNMFPLSDIDPTLTSPLTPTEFIQRILVPEVALRLIMEDRGLEGDKGTKEALEILRESSAYGVAMFPEDDGDPGLTQRRGGEGKMGAGDRIVMERARKRRKELAAEDAKEEEERRLQKELEERNKEKERKAEDKIRKEKKQKQKNLHSAAESNEPVAAIRRRPRPIPENRVTAASGVCSDTGMDPENDPLTKRRVNIIDGPIKPRSRIGSSVKSRSHSRSSASTGTDIEIEESQTRCASSEGSRRSLSASESRNTRIWMDVSDSSDVQSSGYDTESSKKAMVDGGAKSRRKGRTVARSKINNNTITSSQSDSNDSEVQFVETTKTPKKSCGPYDDGDTPKPSKPPDRQSPTEKEYRFLFSSQG